MTYPDPFENDHFAGPRVATAASDHPDTATALRLIVAELMTDQPRPPDFVSIHHGAARAGSAILPLAQTLLPGSALHGASSCRGVMTDRGMLDADDTAIGVFAVWDARGAFGSAMAPLGDCPRTAACDATRTALARAGRPGEAPGLLWLSAAPGQEEAVLDGIRDVVGHRVLIVGASAADAAMTGGWSVFSHDGVTAAGVAVSVLFPSAPVASVFGSGYAPTGHSGTVTAAQGLSLQTIDGRPAAEVYGEWRGDPAPWPAVGRRAILSEAALAPLGRRLSEIDGIETYLLAHPAAICPDGSLELFSAIRAGERLHLMTGSQASLVQRAGRIASRSRERLGEARCAGALVVYCAGCMLAVRDRMPEVVDTIRESLGSAPFLGVFSYGEQGEPLDGGAMHANLMISCTTFAAPPDPPISRE